jgi:hypothetical protein
VRPWPRQARRRGPSLNSVLVTHLYASRSVRPGALCSRPNLLLLRKENATPRQLERLSALAGILAVALWVAAVAVTQGEHIGLAGGLPEEGADETLAYFRENESSVVTASTLFMVGSLLFMWFIGVLRARLVAAEGRAEIGRAHV